MVSIPFLVLEIIRFFPAIHFNDIAVVRPKNLNIFEDNIVIGLQTITFSIVKMHSDGVCKRGIWNHI